MMNNPTKNYLLGCSIVFALSGTFSSLFGMGENDVLSVNSQNELSVIKQEADALIRQDRVEEGLKLYQTLLNRDRNVLSTTEKIQIARYYSWIDKVDEGIQVLRQTLQDNPENSEAKTALARFLSWTKQSDEAMKQVDEVLTKESSNPEALQIKADLLAWNGDPLSALPYYQKTLAISDTFDARLGYAYAQLSLGKLTDAKSEREKLTPKYPYQVTNLAKFDTALKQGQEGGPIDVPTSNSMDIPFVSYYHDSDGNIVKTLRTTYYFTEDKVSGNIGYRHGDATAGGVSSRYDSVQLKLATTLYENLKGSAGIGYIINRSDATHNALTAHAGLTYVWNTVEMGVALYRDALVDTAELINKSITVNGAEVSLSKELENNNVVYGSFAHREYSDDNYANDIRGVFKHRFDLSNPRITAGYSLRYLDFDRQSRGGYFDPDDFIAHQALVSIVYQQGASTLFFDPYIGFQSFSRYDQSSDDFFSGGSLRWRYQITPKMYSEANAEAGNYALGQTAGYNYYLVGWRLNIAF